MNNLKETHLPANSVKNTPQYQQTMVHQAYKITSEKWKPNQITKDREPAEYNLICNRIAD